MKSRRVILIAILCLAAGCARGEREIIVGSKLHTEALIHAEMTSRLLERHGFDTTERLGMGSMIARQGLLTGQLDLYGEYTGTAWTLYHAEDRTIDDPRELYRRVAERDEREHGIVWLGRSNVDNTYALAVQEASAQHYGRTLSDLAAYVRAHPGELRFGVAHEFYERPDGFQAMIEHYDMPVDESRIVTMDIGLSFESLARGQIDVAMVFSTDGKLIRYNLLVLEDDRRFFPVYNLAINIRRPLLKKFPELETILRPLATELDNATMQRLNYAVDGEGKPEGLVAEEFLRERGLL